MWNLDLIYRISNPSETSGFSNRDLIDGIIINARLACSQQNWTQNFIISSKKNILIDPQTAIYSIEIENLFNDNDELRISENKYLNKINEQIYEIVSNQRRELLPTDFKPDDWNEELIVELCKTNIKIQKDFFRQSSLTDFIQLIDANDAPFDTSKLLAVIPPYFYFESREDPWYEITKYLAEKTKNLSQEPPTYPILCFNKEILLQGDTIDMILEDYSEFSSIIIHISDFDELKEEVEYLTGLINFLEKAKISNINIINLYGGFFSFLLGLKGLLHGYSQGICYGNKKDIIKYSSTGGGGISNRYYFKINQTKLVESKARTILSFFPEIQCTCTTCAEKDNSDMDTFFSQLDAIDYKTHFLNNLFNLKQDSYEQIIANIKQNIETINNNHLNNFGLRTRHLTNWLHSLNEL